VQEKTSPRFSFTPGKQYVVHCIEENVGLHLPLDVLNLELSRREINDDKGKAIKMLKLDFIKYFQEKI
jgi:hypothetical protein